MIIEKTNKIIETTNTDIEEADIYPKAKIFSSLFRMTIFEIVDTDIFKVTKVFKATQMQPMIKETISKGL